jgi:SAM-dependent methyltransferase
MRLMTTAETELPPFDKYFYYTASVQDPPGDMRFLTKVYRDYNGRKAKPRTLREDFSGAFANCCAWVKADPDRRAIAVDIDPEPLEYGRTHYLPKLKPEQQERIEIVQKDVLGRGLPKADVIAAFNYSHFTFKDRKDLLTYFKNCRATLEPGGVFVQDCSGGPDYQLSNEHVREYDGDGYRYMFEQESFEPLTNEALFHIHFERPGEPTRHKVFTYDWRLWAVPELKDVLEDAGFSDIHVYWEGTAPDGSGNGKYYRTRRANEEPEAWVCYIAAGD